MLNTVASSLALSLYETLLDGRGLLAAVQGLADRIGASSHAIHQIRFRNGRPAGSLSAAQGGVDAEAMQDYARFWVKHDPWARAAADLPVGVHDMARHVPPETLARSRIWTEWGRPNGAAFHALGVVLQKEEALSGGLYFHRRADQQPFEEADLALAEALFPHLRRVFSAEAMLAQARDAAGPALRAGLDALPEGVALLDAGRRLAFANIALRRMVAARDGLSLAPEGGLDTPDPKTRHAVGRAVTAALAALDGQVGLLPFAGSLAAPRPSGGAPWMIRAVPVMRTDLPDAPSGFRGVMLLVTDGTRRASPNAALLARLYGLTPAQAALAAAIAAGRTVQDHAAARGISHETARSHLAAIRRKTGCRRQADLAALFARLPR
ncbi:helix-turn-helix transcriptional regulator [Falsiroseomonas sp. CW058]|uniref:helix-turn-helix transcriptional regulator n=1 Tax=Falsiroseomonas sp. CW058 TaxID=3388664 RepID=UPI003D31FE56